MISDNMYKLIVENANSIILLMDTKGKITYLNPFGQRFFGYPLDEILEKSVINTIVSEKNLSGQDLVKMIKEILDNPQKHSVNKNENMRANGERVNVLWTNKAIIGYDGSTIKPSPDVGKVS